MDLSLTSDIYEPNINDDNSYIDYLPSSNRFKNGLKCPCGSRKEHIFFNKASFASHIKTKTHHKWLLGINTNKMNYFTECENLKELVNSQKIIIARLEKELNNHKNAIISLAQQLASKESSCCSSTNDLLTFEDL